MTHLSIDALYFASFSIDLGYPKDEVDLERFRSADCTDWSLWDGRKRCTEDMKRLIDTEERFRELIDWDELKYGSYLTENELVEEIAFQCWNWYWGNKIDSGEFEEIEKELKQED